MKVGGIAKTVEVALLAFALVIPFSAGWRIGNSPVPLTAIGAVAIICIAGVAWVMGRAPFRFRGSFPKGSAGRGVIVCAVLFLLACALSGIHALDARLWAKELFQVGLFFLFTCVIWLYGMRSFRIEHYAVAILIAAVAVSVLGVIQYVWGVDLGIVRNATEGGRIRAFGGLQYPNKLGVYLTGAMLLAIGFAARRDRLGRAALWSLLPLVACFIATLSRSAWVGGLAGALMVLALQPRAMLRPVLFAVVLAAIFSSVMALDNRSRSESRPESAPGTGTIRVVALTRQVDLNRAQLLRLGARLILGNPLTLGCGLGNAEKVIRPETERMSLAVPEAVRRDLRVAGSFHNAPIQLWVEAGPLAVAAALALLYWLFRAVWSAPEELRRRPEFAALTACVAAILFTGVFDWLFTRGTGDLLFYSAGVLLAWIRTASTNADGACT